jgi:predicted DCC family thiol-disulfide oxidoreductase YuxK
MDVTGWTGGQYSLFRSLFGAWLFVHFCGVLGTGLTAPEVVPTGVAVACSVLFLIGLADRAAALTLAASGLLLDTLWLPAVPLLLHCFLAPAPYGSWAARGRSDPAGGWTISDMFWRSAVAALAGGYVCMIIALLTHQRVHGAVPGFAALHVLAFDPAWIRPIHTSSTPDRIFYDGSCGLCHRAVRFLLAEDHNSSAFRFAPLQSRIFLDLVSDELRDELADSIVILTHEGTVLTRAQAILRAGRRLGGFWRALAEGAAAILPAAALDRLYDTVARHRYQLFTKPAAECPLVPEHLRRRFDA